MVRRAETLLFVLAALALTGCGKDSSPVSPTRNPESPSPVSLTISGTTSLDHPGETGHLTATATFADGKSRDVTAEASWVGQEDFIAVTGPGFITAVRYGTGTVNASYRRTNGTAWVRVAPRSAFLIRGSVTAAGGFPLARARVEFSSRCGTHSTLTDVSGGYILPADGPATMRAEMDGLRAQIKQVIVGADGRVDFELQRPETASDISGVYKLTVIASPSCVLPPEVMRRSYDANILQTQQDLFVLLSGARLSVWGGQPGFMGSLDQATVHFVVRDTYDNGYNFIERIDSGAWTDPGSWLYYSGTATGTADQARIVAAFNGKLEIRSSGDAMLAMCEATDHRFELTRSGSR